MNTPVRLALIGCGNQMQKNLIPFLQRTSQDYMPVVCVDPDATRATYVQTVTRAYEWKSSIDGVDVSSIDAAIIAVPPQASAELTEALVRQGVHCFVEKPAGPSTDRLRKLAAVLGDTPSNVRVQVGFNFRYAEAIRQLHALTSDVRNSPCAITIEFYSRHPSSPQWGVDTTVESWIRQNGVHAFDLARWLIPSPIARTDEHILVANDPDHFLATLTMHHTNGSLSTLRLGNQTQRFLVSVSVHAADGSVYSAPSLENVVLSRNAGMPSGMQLFGIKNLDHGWARSGFGPELEAFLTACSRGRSTGPYPTVDDALAGSVLCDKVLAGIQPLPRPACKIA